MKKLSILGFPCYVGLHTILNDRKLLKIIPPCFADKFKNGYVGIISVKKGKKILEFNKRYFQTLSFSQEASTLHQSVSATKSNKYFSVFTILQISKNKTITTWEPIK